MTEWEAIVVDLDGGDRLERCLRSLEAQTHPPSRVLIVDNGSDNPVSNRIGSARSVTLQLLRAERNMGFTGGVELGWKRTEKPFLALINNDVELLPEWAGTMIDALERDDRIAAVQSIIAATDGTIDGAGIGIDDGRFIQLGHGEPAVEPSSTPWGISATAALFRRAALEEVSIDGRLLHPRFFAYYEDVELSARLLEAGWRVSLVRQPLAVHEGSKTARAIGVRADYLRTRNRYFVHRLHRGVGSLPALLLEDLGKLARAVSRLKWTRFGVTIAGVVSGLFARI